MQIYYSSLGAIEQQTLQLDDQQCHHCKQTQHLVSHGFVRRKQVGAAPKKIGKRVICSKRYHRSGCGRTMQLYLDSTLRYLHYATGVMEAFVLALLAGITIQCAYLQATHTAASRNAYRWLHKLSMQVSAYRSLFHQPPLSPLSDDEQKIDTHHPPRRRLLTATLTTLLQQVGSPLCAGWQLKWQRSFL